MRCLILLVLVAIEIVYVVVGGFIFWALESTKEEQQKAVQRSFNLSQVVLNLTASFPCLSDGDLMDFAAIVLEAERNGWIEPRVTNDWDIYGSIFFAMTVVTTIGYGNVAPTTPGSRVFCCFFAIIGIPFTMVMLLGLGDRLKVVSRKVNCSIAKGRPRLNSLIRTATVVTAGVVFFLLIPAAVFTRLEGWSYGSAIYYGIITTATVGFGDYVAGWDCVGSLCWLYRISVGIWVFLGLAWLAGLIGSIQDVFQSMVTKRDAKNSSEDEEEAKREEGDGISAPDGTKGIPDTAGSNDVVVPLDTTNSVSDVDTVQYASIRL